MKCFHADCSHGLSGPQTVAHGSFSLWKRNTGLFCFGFCVFFPRSVLCICSYIWGKPTKRRMLIYSEFNYSSGNTATPLSFPLKMPDKNPEKTVTSVFFCLKPALKMSPHLLTWKEGTVSMENKNPEALFLSHMGMSLCSSLMYTPLFLLSLYLLMGKETKGNLSASSIDFTTSDHLENFKFPQGLKLQSWKGTESAISTQRKS